MARDFLKLIKLSITFAVPLLFQLANEKICAIIHKYIYRSVADPQNVVIVGGSFAGLELARKLMHSLPTGYRVVLIERNSHFHYTFNFPRYSVLQGHERLAFIPYDGFARGAPVGAFKHVHDEVTGLSETSVQVKTGESVPYAYLVLATGCSQSGPAGLHATQAEDGCVELRQLQGKIETASRIAVVGGGAVGVELVADVKSYYPEKEVTLVHSRKQLLSRFGLRLHDHVLAKLKDIGVEVLLNARPEVLPPTPKEKQNWALHFKDGSTREYDLVIPCTGQSPNTSILADFVPDAICQTTRQISVLPTLQIASSEKNVCRNAFAVGDVADTSGPKMARAAFFQVSTVQKNILYLIQGREPAALYKPRPEIEGALKLTLGKSDNVVYTQMQNGDDILIASSKGNEDLEVKRAWKMYNADSASVIIETS